MFFSVQPTWNLKSSSCVGGEEECRFGETKRRESRGIALRLQLHHKTDARRDSLEHCQESGDVDAWLCSQVSGNLRTRSSQTCSHYSPWVLSQWVYVYKYKPRERDMEEGKWCEEKKNKRYKISWGVTCEGKQSCVFGHLLVWTKRPKISSTSLLLVCVVVLSQPPGLCLVETF